MTREAESMGDGIIKVVVHNDYVNVVLDSAPSSSKVWSPTLHLGWELGWLVTRLADMMQKVFLTVFLNPIFLIYKLKVIYLYDLVKSL